MAIGTPTQRKVLGVGSQTSTTAFSPTTTLAAGTLGILLATSAGAGKTITGVTDSVGGNTWVVDITSDGATGIRTVSSVSCQVVTPITSGGTITITWSNATSATVDLWLMEVTGLAAASVFDKSAVGTGVGTAASSGATATLTQADEIVFGLGRCNSTIRLWTKGATYTDATTPTSTQGISTCEYKIVAATTAVTADGTYDASTTWIQLAATYKMAAAAAGGQQPGFAFGFT